MIYNAKITNADIGFESHGILTLRLDFRYTIMGRVINQSLPLYRIRENAGDWIESLLRVLEVSNISELKDKVCRLQVSDAENHIIEMISHITEEKHLFYADETKKVVCVINGKDIIK